MGKTFIDLFREAVSKYPDNTAVKDENGTTCGDFKVFYQILCRLLFKQITSVFQLIDVFAVFNAHHKRYRLLCRIL